jgi:hypothetical protein
LSLASQVLSLVALVLAALAFRSTEYYTTRYQTLPVLDWLESRAPLAESRTVPPAADLAHGLLRAMPLLVIRDDVRPLLPVFGPPAIVQRTVGGVRDAARLTLGAPPLRGEEAPIAVRLDVIVFHRPVRAAAWSELMARELDVRDPHNGAPQVRVAGPEAQAAAWEGVWLVAPGHGGGVATVAGHRGVVGYTLQMTYARSPATRPEDQLDLSARADAAVRSAAHDWIGWLDNELRN